MVEETKKTEIPAKPVEEVKKEVDIKETVPEKPKEEEFKPLEIPSEEYLTSPLFYEVANYFNIEQKEYQGAADKLSVITDWAIGEANSNKLHNILPVIRHLEDEIMRPSWGESRLGVVYRYLRLAVKRDAWDKALSSMRRNPKNNE